MSNEADTILSSLPTLTGTGIFNVNQIVADSSFSPTSPTVSTSYSYPLMNPARLIGSITAPFMNVALPTYISTLYNNVFNINNNLQNNIASAAIDDRRYPTSFAVQNYVQSQIAGTQILSNNDNSNNVYNIVTTLNNTLIQQVPNASLGFQYVDDSTNIQKIALLTMDTSPDAPRVGTSKIVIFADASYFSSGNGDNLIFLYAGDNSFFAHMGGYHKYYQFVYTGDFVSFIQAYRNADATATPPVTAGWIWLVTNCMGVFSDTINVSNANISKTTTPVPVPANGTFGGLTA